MKTDKIQEIKEQQRMTHRDANMFSAMLETNRNKMVIQHSNEVLLRYQPAQPLRSDVC